MGKGIDRFREQHTIVAPTAIPQAVPETPTKTKPEPDRPKPAAPPAQIRQEGRSNIAQIGNNNVATIYEAPRKPELKLRWESFDISPTDDFKYRKEVKITTNIDYSPVSLALMCDNAPSKIDLSFKQFAAILTNELTGIDPKRKAAFFHFETAVISPNRPLYVILSSNEPFKVVDLKLAVIPGVNSEIR